MLWLWLWRARRVCALSSIPQFPKDFFSTVFFFPFIFPFLHPLPSGAFVSFSCFSFPELLTPSCSPETARSVLSPLKPLSSQLPSLSPSPPKPSHCKRVAVPSTPLSPFPSLVPVLMPARGSPCPAATTVTSSTASCQGGADARLNHGSPMSVY